MTTETQHAEVENQDGGRAEGRRPDHEITRFDGGFLRIAIWVNDNKKEGPLTFSVKPSCRYQDKQKNWQTARSFTGQQLLSLSKLFLQADSWCEAYRERQYASRKKAYDTPI